MSSSLKIKLISFLILLNGCVKEFIPRTGEDKELLVVDGLITNQPVANVIKLSSSNPLGVKSDAKPVEGCALTITDNLGNVFNLTESSAGTYVTDPMQFMGIVGRVYTLHIHANSFYKNFNFDSYPVEMKPVPHIDSLYYEKVAIEEFNGDTTQEGCQVYLNTHDPTNQLRFFRWEYAETWEFHLPYTLVSNNICWFSNNSDDINIKNTSALEEVKIERYPINFISNLTDRLSVRYSILVTQYSLNEDEYLYWEKLQSTFEDVGGLYDKIPSGIPSNVYCIENPNEKVLGYFSVSASTSKRIFIKDHFAGLIDLYAQCNSDTIFNGDPVPNLNTSAWIITAGLIVYPYVPSVPPNPPSPGRPPTPYVVFTTNEGCADCTVRGTKIEPDFW